MSSNNSILDMDNDNDEIKEVTDLDLDLIDDDDNPVVDETDMDENMGITDDDDANIEDEDDEIIIDETDLEDTDEENQENQEKTSTKRPTITINDVIKSNEDEIEMNEGDDDEENYDTDQDYKSSDDESVDLNTKELSYSKNNLYDTHFSCKEINYKELNALSKVVKKKKVIVDNMHKTLPILTRFEKTKVLGLRVKQLNNNSEPLYEVPPNIINSFDIAEEELNRKLLPFIIKRPIGNRCEYWKLSDLKII